MCFSWPTGSRHSFLLLQGSGIARSAPYEGHGGILGSGSPVCVFILQPSRHKDHPGMNDKGIEVFKWHAMVKKSSRNRELR